MAASDYEHCADCESGGDGWKALYVGEGSGIRDGCIILCAKHLAARTGTMAECNALLRRVDVLGAQALKYENEMIAQSNIIDDLRVILFGGDYAGDIKAQAVNVMTALAAQIDDGAARRIADLTRAQAWTEEHIAPLRNDVTLARAEAHGAQSMLLDVQQDCVALRKFHDDVLAIVAQVETPDVQDFGDKHAMVLDHLVTYILIQNEKLPERCRT